MPNDTGDEVFGVLRRDDDVADGELMLLEVEPYLLAVFEGGLTDPRFLGYEEVSPETRGRLAKGVTATGNVATNAGNIAKVLAESKDLYKLSAESAKLLSSGAQMAVKDGHYLGAIFQNGKVVAQARFVPATVSMGAAIAEVGPAVAMIGMQMQMTEISNLLKKNIAATTEVLQKIRSEQLAELEGLAKSIDSAFNQARRTVAVPETIWEMIAPSAPLIRKQFELYRGKVVEHSTQLKKAGPADQRKYIAQRAQEIDIDTTALLQALKMQMTYEVLRAERSRVRGLTDPAEERVFNDIRMNSPKEIKEAFEEVRSVAKSLVQELNIMLELRQPSALWQGRSKREGRVAKEICTQLLAGFETLLPEHDQKLQSATPDLVCAPEGLELDPYLRILRWFLEDGETLRAIAFPYEVGSHNFTGIVPGLLSRRVDATWDALVSERIGAVAERLAPSLFVAVTDRRIFIANPRDLLNHGHFGSIYSLDEVCLVRVSSFSETSEHHTIKVTIGDNDLHWLFPSAAASDDVDNLAAILKGGAPDAESGEEAQEEVDAAGRSSSILES